MNRPFDLNSGCLRSSDAWGMGEHSSLEAQDSEFLRDERAVRAFGAFEAFETALSTSSGDSAVAGQGGADTPPAIKISLRVGHRAPSVLGYFEASS